MAVGAPVRVGISTRWLIRGRNHWLWRAVDDEGEVLDFLVQPRRCARSARRLLRKLLKKQGFAPKRITTDKLKSYAVAIRKERLTAVHDQGLRANNRAETFAVWNQGWLSA